MAIIIVALALAVACAAQQDSCAGVNPVYPTPPYCTNFPERDTAVICYTFTAPDASVYFNPYVIASCSNVIRNVYLYDSACVLVDSSAFGFNQVTVGASYTVCFEFICDGIGTGISGQCVFDNLPIQLIYFEAKYSEQKGAVWLTWATASEVNSDYFVVERATRAGEYYKIALIEAAGNSTEQRSYKIVDYAPQQMNYYRLVQVDYDGTQTIAAEAAVDVPFSESVVNVYDMYGRQVYSGDKDKVKLRTGLYVVYDGYLCRKISVHGTQ